MSERFDEDDLNILYSEDDSDAYVVTVSSAKLGLMSEPNPEAAPLYMNLETGDGFYPDGISPNEADYIARHVMEESPIETSFFTTEKNEERWREEFSGLFDKDMGKIETRDTELDGDTSKRPYPY